MFLWFSKKQNQYFQMKAEKEQADKERDRLLSENENYRQKEEDWITQKAKSEHLEKELKNQKESYEQRIQEKEEALKKEMENMQTYHKQLAKTTEDQFKSIAHKIFQESSKESTQNISQMLNPVKENIEKFKESIQKFTNKEKSMDENISIFREINTKMRDETLKLSQTLKGDSKAQGKFGEILLGNLLEKSGLREGEDFFLQAKGLQLKSEEGMSLRPDAVVKLPDKKYIIIDSKVSFTHYHQLSSSETKEQRKETLKKFFNSVNSHIDSLSSKEYQFAEDIQAFGFTLMFVPNDGVLALIAQSKDSLFDKAYDKSIIIVGPSTLLATLKAIASIWKIEKQNKNADEIARQGRLLYDKFAGFVEDMNKIDAGLKTARNSYDGAMMKLKDGRGNLINKAQNLGKLESKNKHSESAKGLIPGVQKMENLGIKGTKEIPTG